MPKQKPIKIFIIAVVLFLVFAPYYTLAAMETKYPPIPIGPAQTLTIDSNSDLANYVVYFYALLSIIGVVIVFLVLVYAGVEFVISGGDPARVSEAKDRIKGGLIGAFILVVSYLILNTINPSLTKPGFSELDCNASDVCVEIKIASTGETEYLGAFGDDANLELNPGDIITIKKYRGLREIWGFGNADYQGASTLLFSDYSDITEANYDSDITAPITIDSTYQSVKVYKKSPGVYIYDGAGQSIASLPPLFLNSGTNLDDCSPATLENKLCAYKNNVRSISIVNDKRNEENYYALVFGTDFDKTDGAKTTILFNGNGGDNASSSFGAMTLFKLKERNPSGKKLGDITLYNALGCGLSTSSEVQTCSINFYDTPTNEESIASACASFSGERVLSMRVNGTAAVILSYAGKKWHTDIDFTTQGTCVPFNNVLYLNSVDTYQIIPFDEKL
ncbi:MAG: pilin [Candidatus Paceibacterota bacterium]